MGVPVAPSERATELFSVAVLSADPPGHPALGGWFFVWGLRSVEAVTAAHPGAARPEERL